MQMNNLLNIVNRIFLLSFILFFLNSCSGLFRSAPARDIPVNEGDRVAKNMAEGRGIKLFGKKAQGGDFQFASSNPLWRATLDTLDFMPILNASYSGGIIVTDWYGEDNGKDSVKITIKFLSNEIRADGLEIIIHEKKCLNDSCQTSLSESNINSEIKLAILKEAALIENNELIKRPDYKGPDFGTK